MTQLYETLVSLQQSMCAVHGIYKWLKYYMSIHF